MSDLPVNVDTTYDDDASDASVKLHQQHHDAIHALYNDIAGATPDLANQGIEAAGAAAAAQAAAVQRANHTGTQAQSTVTNLVSDLAAKAPLASPTFTGTPTAPTAAPGTNSTQVATTEYVDAIGASSGVVVVEHGAAGSTARPTADAVYWIGAATPANAEVHDLWYDGSEWVSPGAGTAPRTLMLSIDTPRIAATGFNTLAGGATTGLNTFYSSSPAVADSMEWDAYLDAGTYKVGMTLIGGSDQGIVTVKLDGSALTTFDGYLVANTQYRLVNSSLTIATSGTKRVKVEVTSKNASSSNYYFRFNTVAFTRTGA